MELVELVQLAELVELEKGELGELDTWCLAAVGRGELQEGPDRKSVV